MGIFRAPRITSAERAGVILTLSEIVFDVDNGLFYTGDDATLGGLPINEGVGKKQITHFVTSSEVDNKQIELSSIPIFPNEVELQFINGTSQINGVDFSVSENVLQWDGLGLDNFIEENDILIIRF